MSSSCTEILTATHAFLRERRDLRVDQFLEGFDWSMPARDTIAARLPCLRHLPRAVEIAGAECRALASALLAAADDLAWGRTYTAEDFGARFIDNYGWTELFGTRGAFVSDRMAGGFLLLGPDIEYPDHHHVAEEIYVPLTGGTEWRKADAPYAVRPAGTVIHHPSEVSHAMRTGKEPLLAFYLWRGGPLAQKSTIGRSPGAGA